MEKKPRCPWFSVDKMCEKLAIFDMNVLGDVCQLISRLPRHGAQYPAMKENR